MVKTSLFDGPPMSVSHDTSCTWVHQAVPHNVERLVQQSSNGFHEGKIYQHFTSIVFFFFISFHFKSNVVLFVNDQYKESYRLPTLFEYRGQVNFYVVFILLFHSRTYTYNENRLYTIVKDAYDIVNQLSHYA